METNQTGGQGPPWESQEPGTRGQGPGFQFPGSLDSADFPDVWLCFLLPSRGVTELRSMESGLCANPPEVGRVEVKRVSHHIGLQGDVCPRVWSFQEGKASLGSEVQGLRKVK